MAKPAISGVSFSSTREPFRPAMERTPEQVLRGMLAGDWQPLEALSVRVCVHYGTCVARFQQQMSIPSCATSPALWHGVANRVAPDQAITIYSPPLD